ncbi:MAG: hypoxanthine phosphoribosyltransferase [Salibacteraceae bacterium]
MISLHGKNFEPSIPHDTIQEKIAAVAERINRDFEGQTPLFLSVLNGAFMFTSDLMKNITLTCEVSFVKVASYEGTESTGTVKEMIGVQQDLKGRSVIVIEDIVDSGSTLATIFEILTREGVADIKVATLLFKPEAYQKSFPVDYVGIEIPNDFVVGFGLDYDGLGRNLKDIYSLA